MTRNTVEGFYCIITQDIKKSFRMTRLFPVNRKSADRFKTTHHSIHIKYSPQHLDISAAGIIPSNSIVQIRQSDKKTAHEVRNIVKEIQDD